MPRASSTLVSRRRVIAAGAAFALAGPKSPRAADTSDAALRAALAGPTVDMHSHAGNFIRPATSFGQVAAPMREGGMSVACLAIVADRPAIRVGSDRRISVVREPSPGELHRAGAEAFARLLRLADEQKLSIVTDAATLTRARANGPAVIVASEGADFLEGKLDPLDEAYQKYHLRHLQLTHYRPNELGDIQTSGPFREGLTPFGADVVRACNRRGIVVDVAHGTYDLVKSAAAVSQKPLVLSHSSLARSNEASLSRLITPDHARAVAATGGVIGIWPPSSVFRSKDAMADGMARMAEIVGIDHVGLGSDMEGLPEPSSLASYAELPALARAMLAHFTPDEAAKILGGNYARVFAATVG